MDPRAWCVVLLLLASPALAQDHLGHGASGLPHGIPDFCATATDRLMVPAGETRTLSGTVETSCLGIHGTVTVASGTIRVDHLIIYADGALLIGTQEQPAIGVEIVIRNRPLDLNADPEQFGQGIIGFGRVWLHGQPTTNRDSRSIVIRSENPSGTRGHVLFTQRADVDIRYVAFLDLGRTRAAQPLDSTTFSGDTATHTGTNQIGRYALHLHHVMGPPPGSGRPYQFQLIGNLFLRGEKWGGITLHRTSFGLIQDNVCRQPTAVCYVEEDGSETGNVWLNNYAGQATGAPCQVSSGVNTITDYDPEGRCPAGFWLRSTNHTIRGAVIEDMQRGIGEWGLCLEIGPEHPCGNVLAAIPLFPGADIADPAQIKQDCRAFDGSMAPCRIGHQAVGPLEDITCRRGAICLDPWWLGKIARGGPPIKNLTCVDVVTCVLPHYTDQVIDGVQASGCFIFMQQFNDTAAFGPLTESQVKNATITCDTGLYRRIGQLQQAPRIRWSNIHGTSPLGVLIRLGDQAFANSLASEFVLEHSTLSGAIFTTSIGPEVDARQVITMRAIDVNGQTFTRTLPESSTPPPTPIDCVVSEWFAWSDWQAVSATEEARSRQRTVITEPANGGLACPALSETETRPIVIPDDIKNCTVQINYTQKRAELVCQ